MSKTTWLEQWRASCLQFLNRVGVGTWTQDDDEAQPPGMFDEHLAPLLFGGSEPEQMFMSRHTALRAVFHERMERYCDELLAAEACCGSPIERVMLSALIVAGTRHFSSITLRCNGSNLWDRPEDDARECACGLVIEPQAVIARYRADFLVSAWFTDRKLGSSVARVVVECDGHDFHERTKEQASRDKARDRAFQKMGHTVFRYSGADIWADALRCSEEAVILLRDRIVKQMSASVKTQPKVTP